jgi:hypothetical protein
LENALAIKFRVTVGFEMQKLESCAETFPIQGFSSVFRAERLNARIYVNLPIYDEGGSGAVCGPFFSGLAVCWRVFCLFGEDLRRKDPQTP